MPAEERGTQRRFAQVKRFNIFLPPVGRTVIPGPDNQRDREELSNGMYLLLFRIEAVTDGLNQSNLDAVNAGRGILNSGGASGFAMPTLRYYVGTGGAQVDELQRD